MKLNVPYVGPITVELPYLAGGAIGTLIVLSAIGYWLWGTTGSQIASGPCTPKETYEVTADDYTKGDPKAPVTIIEYASMTCPHCARFNNYVLPKLEATYVDKGYVRYVFREFPLDSVAMTISVVGRCLGKDAYLPFVSLMFQTQSTWATAENPDLRGSIKEMARRAGMSGDAFEQCLAAGQKDAVKITEIQKTAVQDYCVAGTPAFFMNGKVLAQGELPFAELDQKIRAELTRLGKTLPPPAAPEPATPADGTAPAPADGSATPPAGTAPPATTTPATPAPTTPAPATTPAPTTTPAPATPTPPPH